MWSCLPLQSHPVPTVSPSLWCSSTSRLLIHLVAELTPSLTLLPSSSLCLYCPSLESQLRGLEHSSPQDFLWLSSLNLPFSHVPLFLSFFFFGNHQRASQVALLVKNLPANARDVRDMDSIPGWRRSSGGGHDNPLQYSCLENPMDRGAWWATAHRVAKSWTQLKQLSAFGMWDLPPLGITPMPPRLRAWSLKHRTSREIRVPLFQLTIALGSTSMR